ncbi:hypothetical protein [Saccharopolyspora sp. 6V]|uniref:hypothetical protein n=1 Tax=Saccharopolyspora sp. 6V TaxID=2877239 RepID=UPI001CD37D99|nr:hypothetical protein [Saccharopolyspora sp. 6V]MCA1191231.1 hypothetical protein [Saccharopolyspora sp. 6V]
MSAPGDPVELGDAVGSVLAWMTSEWCSTWHLVGRDACGTVIVSTCGHPLVGRMSRVLDGPPLADGREVCQACVAATSTEPETVRFPALEAALAVMGEHRSFRAAPPSERDPPILWPEADPDAPGLAVYPFPSSASWSPWGECLAVGRAA